MTIFAYFDTARNHWRSGLISSVDYAGNGFTQALGYWESRLWLPHGQGVWPAFWLEGVSALRNRTTNLVEVEALEAYGVDKTKAHQTTHYWTPAGQDIGTSGGHTSSTADLSTGWHVYAVQITQSTIYFFIDDVLQWQCFNPPEGSEAMYCMVDYALGGGWPINLPSPAPAMKVDYVRCYAPWPGR